MKLYEMLEVLAVSEPIQITIETTDIQAIVYQGLLKDCPYFQRHTISEAVTNGEVFAVQTTDGLLNIDINGPTFE